MAKGAMDSLLQKAAAMMFFVHAALERAGIRGLVDGQSVSYDTEQDRRTGKLALKNITDD
jgi:cold shock CspA family protein